MDTQINTDHSDPAAEFVELLELRAYRARTERALTVLGLALLHDPGRPPEQLVEEMRGRDLGDALGVAHTTARLFIRSVALALQLLPSERPNPQTGMPGKKKGAGL